MKIAAKYVLFLSLILVSASQLFADVKIKQRITVNGQGSEQTRMIKGARERRESKMVLSKEDEMDAGELIPSIATITQCDLRQTLQVNDKKKLYTVEPFADAAEIPDTSVKNPKSKTQTRSGGTVTITFTVTDTGERKQMFGLTARHLKVLQLVESSADSCSGEQKSKMETDGWYADFSADFNCPIDLPDAPSPPPSKPDCRDRVIMKRSGTTKLGFLLDGIMTSFNANGKPEAKFRTETLEITRSPLDVSFFDVGKDYKLAANTQDLYAMPSMAEMMGMAREKNSDISTPKSNGRKSIGLNVFTGDVSKIDQNLTRQRMLESLNSKGFATSFVTSQNEIVNGRFDYVISVNIVSVKQSKAGKIGGLFGKVTGDTSAAKAGDSEAEVIVTVYQKDGGSVIAQQSAKQKIAGSPDDVVNAAIEAALNQLIGKIR